MLGNHILLQAVAIMFFNLRPPDPAAESGRILHMRVFKSYGGDDIRKLAAEFIVQHPALGKDSRQGNTFRKAQRTSVSTRDFLDIPSTAAI